MVQNKSSPPSLCPSPCQLRESSAAFFGDASQGNCTVVRTCVPVGSSTGLTLHLGTNLCTETVVLFFPPAPCQGMRQLLWLGPSPRQLQTQGAGQWLLCRWLVSGWREVAALARVPGPGGRVLLQDGAVVRAAVSLPASPVDLTAVQTVQANLPERKRQ